MRRLEAAAIHIQMETETYNFTNLTTAKLDIEKLKKLKDNFDN